MAGEEKEEAETTRIRLSSTTNTSALFSGQMYLDIKEGVPPLIVYTNKAYLYFVAIYLPKYKHVESHLFQNFHSHSYKFLIWKSANYTLYVSLLRDEE